MRLTFTLNDREVSLETPADRRVLDLLREDLHLTGTKEGCGTGECGACTILVDGSTRLACLMVASQLEASHVRTVEGLAETPLGEAVRNAFVSARAVQCGFSTPGMEMAALALLLREPAPDRERIRQAMSGNLCRCTGFTTIVDAVEQAANRLEDRKEKP